MRAHRPSRRRRQGREIALRALFQVDVGGMSPEEAFGSTAAEFKEMLRNRAEGVTPKATPEDAASEEASWQEVVAFGRQLLEGCRGHLEPIDRLIEKYARGWTLARMANVDRTILRLAVFELFYLPEVPPSVAVDEAVELAKLYSTAESGRFVNGILGNLVRNLKSEKGEA